MINSQSENYKTDVPKTSLGNYKTLGYRGSSLHKNSPCDELKRRY
jgi:hypothetical protein